MERRQLFNEQFSLCFRFVDKKQTFETSFQNLFVENVAKQNEMLVWIRL